MSLSSKMDVVGGMLDTPRPMLVKKHVGILGGESV